MSMADLPKLPAPHKELAKYISDHQETPIVDIIEPYRQYEAQLRTIYAQDRQNPALDNPHLNVLPLFNQDTKHVTTRARDLETESEEEKSRYIMPLPEDKRRSHGSPATVANFAEFQNNFNVFSESSLVDLDWDNVVAAGSSVVNCLLPVPKEFNTTKRKLREYYHEKFCPASDVDLFLYGLTHDEAVEKIKQIEKAVRDALLNEVTVVRTKYALTMASQYPVRHIQVVLRVYKSVSEILTGFDIDAAGGAFDGKQVYVTPRALGSFITQINHIDLTRRSPSYENRLSKYSHRNFEVYWPDLDRSRIDPTIFERSFQRTLGLARLLVLERLPTTSVREAYLNKRRMERGRPTVYRGHHFLGGNIKDYHEDEVADWLSEEDVSNYHTFTVPYGEKFHAKRIEKLCYTRDLLLNAEWNQPKEREVYLHRHPAFFGRVEDIVEDCCGTCPVPKTDDEQEVAEKEREIYISGKVAFMIDDPGRQQIGSFNPLTEQDWTDMAYVGNTARLCQSVVAGDVDDVLNWLSQEDADPNKRDYTGRSALHLAVMASTPEVVKCLVDHGSRLTARLADGRTALHLAAARGDAEMIKTLMEKSIENEEVEEERQAQRRKAAKLAKTGEPDTSKAEASGDDVKSDGSDSDGELIDGNQTETDVQSMATGSFVKVKKNEGEQDDVVPEESDDDPDYYQIDVLAWDVKCSPLHLAIAGGNEDAVKLLCDYGADAMLPVKFMSQHDTDTAAILTLVLALTLPLEKAKSMTNMLLKQGVTSSQAEYNGCTAFHRFVADGKPELIENLLDHDKTGVKTAINHLLFGGYSWNPLVVAPLQTAIESGDSVLVLKLLNVGAKPSVDFETWLKAAKASPNYSGNLKDLESNKEQFGQLKQPILTAIQCGQPDIALELLNRGADPNTFTTETNRLLKNAYQRNYHMGASILDIVQQNIDGLSKYTNLRAGLPKPQETPGTDQYLAAIKSGTYQHWVISGNIQSVKEREKQQVKKYEEEQADQDSHERFGDKEAAIAEILDGLKTLKKALIAKGAKTFKEHYPDIKTGNNGGHYTISVPKSQVQTERPKVYEYNFNFRHDGDMTDKRKDAYIELMEAAWVGDMDRVKSFTLQAWGPDQDQPPLKMSIDDGEGDTPFSIAFLRGHYQVASGILEIVKAQWTSPEKDKLRYKLETQEEHSDEDEYSDASEDSEPRIISELVDKKFTIEDLGEVSMQVKSHIKPIDVICEHVRCFTVDGGDAALHKGTRTLFRHTFERDDTVGFKKLLDLAQHWASQKFDSDNDEEEHPSSNFSLPHGDFIAAIDSGNVQMLGTIIKKLGAGIPLDHLVKKSGLQMHKKPRYYQGLTVYGKKRKDWATAGRNMVVKTTGLKSPPLLHAALAGSQESVEFFLSDTPHRFYGEFVKSKAGREDTRLQHLKESPGGFDRAISKWLGADNELVIHCAVMADPKDQSFELLEYLVETCPSALEKKNTNGDTPLQVACRLGRTQFVKILIAGNADQSVRNNKGENIIHAALAGNPTAHRLQLLLDHLDPELRASLFLQRRNLHEDGNSPIQAWVSQVCGTNFHTFGSYGRSNYYYDNSSHLPYHRKQKDLVDMLQLLLKYSEGNGLDLLNSAGDTSLHSAIMKSNIAVCKVLIDYRPSLLYRENAVGRTPGEMANDLVVGQQFVKPETLRLASDNKLDSLCKKKPEDFHQESEHKKQSVTNIRSKAKEIGLSGDYTAKQIANIATVVGLEGNKDDGHVSGDDSKRVVHDLCATTMSKNPDNRRLVSLNEANDVARRLGEQQSSTSRYFSVHNRHDEDEEEEDDADKPETEDFAAQELKNRLNKAWSNGKKEDIPEECSDCGERHD